jgi:hypothetical protein
LTSDEHIQITLDRLLSGLRGPLEAAFRASGEEAAGEARRQGEEQLTKLRAEAEKQHQDIRTAAETQIADLTRMLDEIRSTAQQQIVTAERLLDTEVTAVRTRAKAELDEAQRTAQSQVDEVRRSMNERLRAVTRELDEARGQLDGARTEAQAARHELEAAQRKTEAAQQRASSVPERRSLADDLRSLDAAGSLSDVLDRLAQAAVHHAERAAVLVVKAERLRGWKLIGFVESVDVALDESGIAADALRERRPVTRFAGASGRVPAFVSDADSRDAAASPVMVAGTVVALVYADAPGGPTAARGWFEDLDVLARYASRVLETLTVQQATGMRPVHGTARSSQPAAARGAPGGLS